MFEAVESGLAAPGASAPFCTADEGFDALNASVGVVAVQTYSFGSSVVVRFDPRRDVELAASAYASLEGVRHVEPNFLLGDGSDIDARWVDGAWYLVFRAAWGDCPSGCLYSELHFSTERSGEVQRVTAKRAEHWAPFARILLDRRWRHRRRGARKSDL